MNQLLQKEIHAYIASMAKRKLERRKQLAALPVGEKLRMLAQMQQDIQAIQAVRPPPPKNPLRLGGRSSACLISTAPPPPDQRDTE